MPEDQASESAPPANSAPPPAKSAPPPANPGAPAPNRPVPPPYRPNKDWIGYIERGQKPTSQPSRPPEKR
jgi:hypothetical protein